MLAKTAQLLSAAYGLVESEVLESLEAREALGSTGFGRGVAIPHCRSKGVRLITIFWFGVAKRTIFKSGRLKIGMILLARAI